MFDPKNQHRTHTVTSKLSTRFLHATHKWRASLWMPAVSEEAAAR
ncbi:hypothetical protein RA11412_0548 [Rothia aeria]|uniref:Uncharacterized protein n=1 Tax=Rothia aeria TaxID=172042 RepID=A0A2Z5QWP3_9MICC|nr:hypothetical protein RA11412_0548 [Rothia aeria]